MEQQNNGQTEYTDYTQQKINSKFNLLPSEKTYASWKPELEGIILVTHSTNPLSIKPNTKISESAKPSSINSKYLDSLLHKN